MSYLQPSNKNGKKNNRRTVSVVLLVCVFVTCSILFPQTLFRIGYSIFSPFWHFELFITNKIAYSFELLRSKSSLVKENESLKNKDLVSSALELSLNDALTQNATLKELLGRTDKFKYVLGVILRKPPYSPYDTIIIDAGENNGVVAGDKVYAPNNVLLGDVVEVYPKSSKISLFSTPGRETSVVVGDKNVEATAMGKGGGNFSVELPVGAEIAIGDTIKAPTLGVSILGVVEDIKVDESDSLQSILFKSPFNIHDLYFVEVETNLNSKDK